MNPCVHVVHCVDTEGPLYESLEATFERLNRALGLELQPSRKLLRQIQAGEAGLGDQTETARKIVAPELLGYMQDWGQLDAMLDEILSGPYRNRFLDPAGRGWLYSWFVLDHVGYDVNPRRRDIGYHNVFDHYTERLKDAGAPDEMHWHFHPMSQYREAHVCATSFLNSPHLLQGLARRVIDRAWFPTAFRAGFHTERPDSHWFLEQWIPIDYSNQGMAETALERGQQDIGAGRFGDWRRAPTDWAPYHPSHDDYQTSGTCNRTIFRCLNVGTRLRLLTQDEVDRAFLRCTSGKSAVLAFCNHDFRDMRRDIAHVHSMLENAAHRFPQVPWHFSGAREAAREVLGWKDVLAIDLEARIEVTGRATRLVVTANQPTFGPQPFLAIKTWDKRYFTDNFDVHEPRRAWTYTFDSETVSLQAVEKIGVAATGRDASCDVVLLDATGAVKLKRNIA